ncbi:hypothetical protein LY76DRAFT_618603 [Colletotrichum caudatum]|nr:hypothetical protein LY76DRAFT_618603 [Colletotrichum caudatum]
MPLRRSSGLSFTEKRILNNSAANPQWLVLHESPTSDATVFHPQGGGQPSDRGVMEDASSGGAGDRFHALHRGRFTKPSAAFRPGQKVTQTIDAGHRLLCSRYHTAGHVLGAAVRHLLEDRVEGFEETKASHFPGLGVGEIQQKVDAFVREDMPVEVQWWGEEGFRTNGMEKDVTDREALGMDGTEKSRVVTIVGAGTHVDSTGLCGKTTVKKISRSKGTSRVSYSVAE